MAPRPIAFTGGLLDRADQLRSNPAALGALLGPRARVLRLEGLEPLLDTEGRLEWGSLAEVAPGAELIFLGLDREGRGHFAAAPERANLRELRQPQTQLTQQQGFKTSDIDRILEVVAEHRDENLEAWNEFFRSIS